MLSSPNWGALYAQGRCKAVGVPWSEQELAARALGIPVEFIRNGVLTSAAYKKELEKVDAIESKTGAKPMKYWNKSQLVERAQKLEISFDPQQTTNQTILSLIEEKEKGATNSVVELPGSDEVVPESHPRV